MCPFPPKETRCFCTSHTPISPQKHRIFEKISKIRRFATKQGLPKYANPGYPVYSADHAAPSALADAARPAAPSPVYRPLWMNSRAPYGRPHSPNRIHSARFTRTYSAEIPSRLLTVWRTSNLPHHRTSSDTIVPYFPGEIKSKSNGKGRNIGGYGMASCAI